MVEIIIKKGDLTTQKVDAIVNPANSYGIMGGGVAYAIKKSGGEIIEEEAVSKAPIPVGSAIETTAGGLPCTYVIHAPTMIEPTQKIDPHPISKATKAALRKASELGLNSLAFPGLGCGVGGVSKSNAAKAMIDSILGFNPNFTVYLIGFDEELTEEFKRWLVALNLDRK